MNYTKGEWEVGKHGLTYPISCGKYSVATGIYNKDNANLISAAPGMYEALKDILEQANKTHLPLGADLSDSIKVFGKQAIAKAEGK